MPNSLLTGVSGLLAHQRLLDIVGHNISNANTVGFKAQRVLFSDLFYEVINPATSGGDGDSGGVNPNEIGGGVQLAMTDRKFAQGGLTSTGEQFDVAISGGDALSPATRDMLADTSGGPVFYHVYAPDGVIVEVGREAPLTRGEERAE